MSISKPVITAVNIIILNEENKVLLAKRLPDKPMPNKWEFPGGKLEDNESLQRCGIREIKEELDLDIKIQEYLGYENIHYEGKDFILHFFTATLVDPAQTFYLHEHSQARWVSVDAFDEYDFPANKLEVIQTFKKTF